MTDAQTTSLLSPSPYIKAETLLQINGVKVQYGDKVVLRDVNAEIQNIIRTDCIQGQVVCFLGPSGIGKTQLSRVIAGLQAPHAGSVLVDCTGTLRPVQRGDVGMVPQNYPLFEYLTVFNNLIVAGKQNTGTHDAIDAPRKADELLTQLGLQDYRNRWPRELSGGTRQRVAIVRQLMVDRHFFVMDEPFSGLDPIMKRKAAELLAAVANRDERNTIIVVTHDVTEGLSIADTVWMLGREPGRPGATLVETYDMAAMGLCWHPDILQDAAFQKFVGDVKGQFAELAGV